MHIQVFVAVVFSITLFYVKGQRINIWLDWISCEPTVEVPAMFLSGNWFREALSSAVAARLHTRRSNTSDMMLGLSQHRSEVLSTHFMEGSSARLDTHLVPVMLWKCNGRCQQRFWHPYHPCGCQQRADGPAASCWHIQAISAELMALKSFSELSQRLSCGISPLCCQEPCLLSVPQNNLLCHSSRCKQMCSASSA